jgi:hypothetical protein
MHKLIAIIVVATFFAPAIAEDSEGNYLYRVTTVRAATGSLSDLLDSISELKATDYFAKSGEPAPLVMRHSQGDQWDLLIITPMNSWETYYENAAIERRTGAAASFAKLLADRVALIAFSEDHFAYGPTFSTILNTFKKNNFFHIEMFKAAAGKSTELLEQRRMENVYLAATGQTTNMIFRRAAGSDVDVFTIGFHQSLEAFAAPANVTDEEKDAAAKSAGFKELSDISFYLRSLISGHNDTLAVRVN